MNFHLFSHSFSSTFSFPFFIYCYVPRAGACLNVTPYSCSANGQAAVDWPAWPAQSKKQTAEYIVSRNLQEEKENKQKEKTRKPQTKVDLLLQTLVAATGVCLVPGLAYAMAQCISFFLFFSASFLCLICNLTVSRMDFLFLQRVWCVVSWLLL